jgi:hypothetical protein
MDLPLKQPGCQKGSSVTAFTAASSTSLDPEELVTRKWLSSPLREIWNVTTVRLLIGILGGVQLCLMRLSSSAMYRPKSTFLASALAPSPFSEPTVVALLLPVLADLLAPTGENERRRPGELYATFCGAGASRVSSCERVEPEAERGSGCGAAGEFDIEPGDEAGIAAGAIFAAPTWPARAELGAGMGPPAVAEPVGDIGCASGIDGALVAIIGKGIGLEFEEIVGLLKVGKGAGSREVME